VRVGARRELSNKKLGEAATTYKTIICTIDRGKKNYGQSDEKMFCTVTRAI